MQRQLVIGALVAVLVVTAGCINNPTNTNGNFPDKLTEEDIEEHRMALNNTDSYQATINLTIEGSGVSVETDQLYRIDRTDNQFYTSSRVLFLGETITEKYTNETATFERSRSEGGFGGTGGNYTYDYAEAPYNNSSDSLLPPLQPVNTTQAQQGFAQLGNLTLEQNGTTTYNGETVGVYTGNAEDLGSLNQSVGGVGSGNATIDEATLRYYLNDDGIIVYQELSASGETERGEYSISGTYQLTGLNSTDVTEPNWTDTAREEAQGSTS